LFRFAKNEWNGMEPFNPIPSNPPIFLSTQFGVDPIEWGFITYILLFWKLLFRSPKIRKYPWIWAQVDSMFRIPNWIQVRILTFENGYFRWKWFQSCSNLDSTLRSMKKMKAACTGKWISEKITKFNCNNFILYS
jgi:hypothetical protein